MTVSDHILLVQQCFLQRSSASEFQDLLKRQKPPPGGIELFLSIFRCRQWFCVPDDHLVPLYLHSILLNESLTIAEALLLLIKKWNNVVGSSRARDEMAQSLVATIHDVSVLVMGAKEIEARKCLLLTSSWLRSLVTLDSCPIGLLDSVGSLLSSIAGTDSGLAELSKDDKKLRAAVQGAAEAALAQPLALSVQTLERLSVVQKHLSIYDDERNRQRQAIQFQLSIAITQIVPNKIATLACLDGMLRQHHTIDDNVLYNFLNLRYTNDSISIFTDILSSSATLSKDTTLSLQCKIFIQNKLPSILALIVANSFTTFSPEELILSENLGDIFLRVCASHHLISNDAVEGGPKGLYLKDQLVTQATENHSKGVRLVEELVRFDGNAGPISQALVDIIQNYCSSKETHYLKDLANNIIRRPTAIDAIAMFVQPSFLLSSLCSLLDQWKWDDIHGESQPIYDEFGSIFLLILCFKKRLDLSEKLGNFVTRYLEQEGCEQNLDELTSEMMKHLGDWIHALFVSEGLSDELTSSCSPQEFYIMIPTLLSQSVMAFERGKLTQETLEGGLQYLLEPWLLPSLMSALKWSKSDIVTAILSKPPSSTEAGEIHRTIMSMQSEPPAAGPLDLEKMTWDAIEVTPAKKCLKVFIDTLLSSSNFILTLDLLATLLVVTRRSELRDILRLEHALLARRLNEPLYAEAVVHLHRRVDAYSGTLMVQTAPIEVPVETIQLEEPPPMDDIDQALNEVAVMESLENIDSMQGDGMALDDVWGMSGDAMGLDDLDLDMF